MTTALTVNFLRLPLFVSNKKAVLGGRLLSQSAHQQPGLSEKLTGVSPAVSFSISYRLLSIEISVTAVVNRHAQGQQASDASVNGGLRHNFYAADWIEGLTDRKTTCKALPKKLGCFRCAATCKKG